MIRVVDSHLIDKEDPDIRAEIKKGKIVGIL